MKSVIAYSLTLLLLALGLSAQEPEVDIDVEMYNADQVQVNASTAGMTEGTEENFTRLRGSRSSNQDPESEDWVPSDSAQYIYQGDSEVYHTIVYREFLSAEVLELIRQFHYIRDEYGNLLQWTNQTWDDNSWVNNFTIRYTLDENGFLIERLNQPWVGGAWENRDKWTYQRNENDLPVEILKQTWESNQWKDEIREDFSYDENNFEIEYHNSACIYTKDPFNCEWTYDYKYTYENDENGNNTKRSRSIWIDEEWILDSEDSYEYDNNNNLTLHKIETFDLESGTLLPQALTLYEYDENNNNTLLTEYEPFADEWQNSTQTTFEYNSYNDITKRTKYNWSSEFSVWQGDRQIVYYYDEVIASSIDNEHSTELDIEISPNPSSGNINLQLGNTFSGKTILNIYDQAGKKVHVAQVLLGTTSTMLDLSFLPPGQYVLHLSNGSMSLAKKVLLY